MVNTEESPPELPLRGALAAKGSGTGPVATSAHGCLSVLGYQCRPYTIGFGSQIRKATHCSSVLPGPQLNEVAYENGRPRRSSRHLPSLQEASGRHTA